MAAPPMSAALSNDRLRGYFLEIASSVDLPIVLQDASGYVGRGVDLDLMVGRALLRVWPLGDFGRL